MPTPLQNETTKLKTTTKVTN